MVTLTNKQAVAVAQALLNSVAHTSPASCSDALSVDFDLAAADLGAVRLTLSGQGFHLGADGQDWLDLDAVAARFGGGVAPVSGLPLAPCVCGRGIPAAVARGCLDAYSFDLYYSLGAWIGCANKLAARGLNKRQIEAVLRSKWMRWAADSADGKGSAAAFVRWLDDPRNSKVVSIEAVNDLVHQTFAADGSRYCV